ncbi:MAG: XdhC family protein [Rhizobiaceae bacterium]
MDTATLVSINDARKRRQPIALITEIATGKQSLATSSDDVEGLLAQEIDSRFKSGKSAVVDVDGIETFIQVHVPPPRLVVIGAVHISQALVPMALACGFDVTVIDPRTAFASEDRFRDVDLIADWPEEILKERPLDHYTALVAVTHDPKIDDIPLQQALDTGCFYIGALGSRKTHAKRVSRFAEAGIPDSSISAIQAPIGMNIGAANPAEIAVAIMAQIIESLRKGPAL